MRITRIFHDGEIASGNILTLDRDTSNHLVQVLRSRVGTVFHVFNGRGGEYISSLIDADPKSARIRVDNFVDYNHESPLKITLLQGISRGEKMDDTIRKATELGVQRIVPVVCERTQGMRTDRMEKKHQRWTSITISACEQSGRTHLPGLQHSVELDVALQQAKGDTGFILDPHASRRLSDYTESDAPDGVTILIGPEGGLSEREVALAASHGFREIRFGPRILRTETAGPAFIAAVQAKWGDMG